MTVAPKLLPLRIRLPYTTEEEFIDKYGSNVARGGVFIATRALKEEGTALAFEFVLADGTRLLRGEGVVVKAQLDESGGRSGMTVRFVKLDAPTKVFIDRLMARRTGEPAAAAEKRPAPPTPTPTPAAAPSPAPPLPSTPPPGLVRRTSQAAASPPEPKAPTRLMFAIPVTAPEPPLREEPPAPFSQPTPPPDVALDLFPPATPPPLVAQRPFPQATHPPAETPAPFPQATTPPHAAPASLPQAAPPSATEPVPLSQTRPSPSAAPAPLSQTTPPPEEPPQAFPVMPSGIAPAGTQGELFPSAQFAPTGAAPASAPAEPAPTSPIASPAAPTPAPSTAPEPPIPSSVPERDAPGEPAPPLRLQEAPRVDSPPPPQSEDTRRALEAKGRRRTVLDLPVTAPVAPPAPEVVLGIDLGTTQARVAVFHEGAVRLVPMAGSDTRAIPSMLAVDASGQVLVGTAAQVEAERAPRHTAMGLKRLIGLRARSPRLRGFVGLPFSVTADPRGDAGVELRGRIVPLSELATGLLRELKSAAATFLGREATRAVLCVPAFFDARQRAALREAGERAGLNVLRVLNAPSAATLAYGHERGLARKRVLVVDLGAGGLEVSVVQVTGDDLEVVTTGSDPTLGGMDFDARIAEALLSELRDRGASPSEQTLDWGPLRAAAEAAKITLSEHEEAPVRLREGVGPTLSRERVEALTADLAQRVTEVTREVLESSSLTPQGLDAVVLVGGQGRAPLVRRRLEESLGVQVRSDVDPLGAAAIGAALLGRSLLEIESGKPGATVSDVLSIPLGVAERGGVLRRVFERNTRLPADKTLALPVTPGPLSLAIFQGSSPLASESEYLGALHFQLERAGEAEIHFSLSQDGILSLAATLPGAKRHPVALATEDLDDAAREALIARSPFATETEARPAGLLSGLRKLFGKR